MKCLVNGIQSFQIARIAVPAPLFRNLIEGSIGIEIYAPDGRGAYFRGDGSFRGFIEEHLR